MVRIEEKAEIGPAIRKATYNIFIGGPVS